jgi:NitT/TauT family transport system substrate-binding protein
MGLTQSIRRIGFAAAATLTIGLTATGNAAAQTRAAAMPVRFSLDWSFQGYHAMWTEAADQGFFAQEGLAVIMDRGFGVTDTISKIASGTYDIGFADVNALVKFDADNPSRRVITFFQVYDKNVNAMMALKRSGITKPKDLEGKTIVSAEADAARLLFPAFARANQIDTSKIKWTMVAPNLRDTLLVQGQGQAVTGYTITSIFNMIAAGAKRDDIVTLPYAELGLDLPGSGLITTQAYADSHPEVLKAFIRAAVKGFDVALRDPKAGVATVLKHDPLLSAQNELDRLIMTIDTAILTPFVKANGYGAVSPERMANMVAINAEAYKIAEPPKPDEIYTTRFLPPASERMPKLK